MTEEKILISIQGGVKLEGLLRKPQGDGTFPAIIMVSGFGMDLHEDKNSNDVVSKRLVDAGFLTVQFNFSVVGSERELALPDRAKELEAVLRWVKQDKRIIGDRIGIHATSFGAPTTLSMHIAGVTSFIFVSGVYWLTRFRKQFQGRGATIYYDKDTDLPRSGGRKTIVGPEFWPSIDAFDPLVIAQKLTAPVLVVHGDQDDKIDTADVKKFYDAVVSKQKKLRIFKNGDHGITDVPRAMREELLKDVVEWFHKTL
ncbi:MAG: prolyl oligopeptidase family serine peptidase [Patescibacteria group bacterium]